jgi:hypothetical protein
MHIALREREKQFNISFSSIVSISSVNVYRANPLSGPLLASSDNASAALCSSLPPSRAIRSRSSFALFYCPWLVGVPQVRSYSVKVHFCLSFGPSIAKERPRIVVDVSDVIVLDRLEIMDGLLSVALVQHLRREGVKTYRASPKHNATVKGVVPVPAFTLRRPNTALMPLV